MPKTSIITAQRREAGLSAIAALENLEDYDFNLALAGIPEQEQAFAYNVLNDMPPARAVAAAGYEPADLRTLVQRFVVRWATLVSSNAASNQR